MKKDTNPSCIDLKLTACGPVSAESASIYFAELTPFQWAVVDVHFATKTEHHSTTVLAYLQGTRVYFIYVGFAKSLFFVGIEISAATRTSAAVRTCSKNFRRKTDALPNLPVVMSTLRILDQLTPIKLHRDGDIE